MSEADNASTTSSFSDEPVGGEQESSPVDLEGSSTDAEEMPKQAAVSTRQHLSPEMQYLSTRPGGDISPPPLPYGGLPPPLQMSSISEVQKPQQLESLKLSRLESAWTSQDNFSEQWGATGWVDQQAAKPRPPWAGWEEQQPWLNNQSHQQHQQAQAQEQQTQFHPQSTYFSGNVGTLPMSLQGSGGVGTLPMAPQVSENCLYPSFATEPVPPQPMVFYQVQPQLMARPVQFAEAVMRQEMQTPLFSQVSYPVPASSVIWGPDGTKPTASPVMSVPLFVSESKAMSFPASSAGFDSKLPPTMPPQEIPRDEVLTPNVKPVHGDKLLSTVLGNRQPTVKVVNSIEQRSTNAATNAASATVPEIEFELVGFLRKARSVADVLETCAQLISELSANELIAGLHVIAKMTEADHATGNIKAWVKDPRFEAVVSELTRRFCEVDNPRYVMRSLWALGKVGASVRMVDGIVTKFLVMAPRMLKHFTTMEMSNSLWGIARFSKDNNSADIDARLCQLVTLIVEYGMPRIHTFSPQCLSNCLWSLAKLDCSARLTDNFGRNCVLQIIQNRFVGTTPQGFANSLWAVAKLRIDSAVTIPFVVDAARFAVESNESLKKFMPQELSMAIWAMAKVVGRRSDKMSLVRANGEVDRFAALIAEEATDRLAEFTPQGISNISWALATLNILKYTSVRHFILASAEISALNLRAFPPQAIANCCWAIGRLENATDELVAFSKAAGREAMSREADFSWQDLSGIVSTCMHVHHAKDPELAVFARFVLNKATGRCREIGNQALLNIALGCARLDVGPTYLTPLAVEMTEVFPGRPTKLNEIDIRQWSEVQRYCGLKFPSDSYFSDRGHSRRQAPRGRRGGKRAD